MSSRIYGVFDVMAHKLQPNCSAQFPGTFSTIVLKLSKSTFELWKAIESKKIDSWSIFVKELNPFEVKLDQMGGGGNLVFMGYYLNNVYIQANPRHY